LSTSRNKVVMKKSTRFVLGWLMLLGGFGLGAIASGISPRITNLLFSGAEVEVIMQKSGIMAAGLGTLGFMLNIMGAGHMIVAREAEEVKVSGTISDPVPERK